MSWWQRLRGLVTGAELEADSPSLKTSPRPALPKPADDDPLLLLRHYSQQLGHLSERPKLVEPAVLRALTTLLHSGNAEPALRLGPSLVRAIPTDFALAQLVAESLCQAARPAEAIGPLQQALGLASLSQSLLLLFQLAEAYRAIGDLTAARRYLAELLALDVQYPEAQTRFLSIGGPRAGQPMLTEPGMHLASVQRAVLPTVAMTTNSRYQLLAELGSGRTGTVYRALDRDLQCELALKVFHPHLRQRGQDDALLRALHEARLLSAARHPGIVALYAVDGDELSESPSPPLLAMELCRGGSLRGRLRQGPLPIDVALRRAVELLETLTELHAGSVSHGDLKPENLLFRGDGRCHHELPEPEQSLGDLVIADFGLSRLGHGAYFAGLGTLGYLSNERLLGGPPSPPADVFAVGVVLLEMLCGQLSDDVGMRTTRAEPLSGSAILHQAPLSQLGEREQPLRTLLVELLTEAASERPAARTAAARLRQLW